ncbi:MAG: Cof-type HAD-IIB family hydrolase [Synergistaceae bacterium]|jgi:Cof subfamily protein (haloacid dehalogenase superfamily)|nr:Cof-type HAD-IIB family hydrolase [Synergistaceae bacterium]
MDGTALHEDKSFSVMNLRAIRRVMESGVMLVPATGRSARNTTGFLTGISGIRYIIGANGALIYDVEEDKTIIEDFIDLPAALSAISTLSELDVNVYAHMRDGIILRSADVDGRFAKLFPMVEFPVPGETPPLAERLSAVREGIPKLGVFAYDASTINSLLSVKNRFLGLTLCRTGPLTVEINSATASKGSALRYLCQRLGIAREGVLAIGDNDNDKTMMEFAGYSVAMGNAIAEIKRIADEVTLTNDEDGVAAFLETHWR